MRTMVTSALTIAVFLSGCGSADKAEETAAQISGSTDKAVPCTIISADKVSALFGATLADAPAGQSQSCQFTEGSDNVAVIVTTVPAKYYEEHQGKDFRKLAGIGDEASIVWELDGWRATARAGENAVVVMTDGATATQDNTIAIMKAVLPTL